MAEKIVGLISCLLCAVPFLIIGIFEKNSKEPITFWSGDKNVKIEGKRCHGLQSGNGDAVSKVRVRIYAFRNLLPDFVRPWDCDACFGLHGRGLSDVSKL